MSTGNKRKTSECSISVKFQHNPRPPTFPLPDRPKKRIKQSLGLDDVKIESGRGLKDTQHGIIFQLNLLALALYRSNRYGIYEDFGLATEVRDAGKFDDVVFVYKKGGKKCMRLIQAKHSENGGSIKLKDLKSEYPHNDFSLLKYFKSYLYTKKLYDDLDSALYNFEIEYTAIVTNKTLTTELLQHFQAHEIANQEDDDLLYVKHYGEPQKYTIKKGSLYDELSEIFIHDPDVSQTVIDDFFEKFRLVANYPNRHEIERMLEAELRNYYQILNSSAKLYILRTEMYDWLAEKTGSFYTNKSARELFERIERKVLCYEMYGLSKSNLMSIPNEYTFQNDHLLEKLKKFLNSNSVFILAIKFETITLGLIRTVQTFKKLRSDEQLFETFTHKFGHILINSKQLRDRDFLTDLMKHLQDKNEDEHKDKHDKNEDDKKIKMWNLIIIEWDDTAEDGQYAIISKLKQSQRKVILISTNKKENILPSEVQKTYQIDTNFSDLEPGSQEKLFKTENVRFQNETMHIGRLIGNQDKSVIDATALDSFLRNEDSVRIGISFPLKTYVERFYIKRHLRLMIWIRSNITDELKVSFTENGSNLQLANANDIIVFSPFIKDFENTVKSIKSRNIHWLKEAEYKYIWKQSKGSVSELTSYRDDDGIEEDECLRIDEDALIEKGEKIVIISGEYGTGKSTLFGSLQKKIKEIKFCWTIRIDLLDYSSFLTEKTEQEPMQPASTSENEWSAERLLIELLKSGETYEPLSTLEERLLRVALQRQENNSDSAKRLKIVLFIDQFSEINLNFQNFALKMLVGLKSTEVYQIFVSTRPATRSALEVALGSFAYEIEPFSEADYLAFFKTRSLDEGALNTLKSWNGPNYTPLYLEILSKIDTERLKTLDNNCIFDVFAMSQPSQDDTQELYERIFQNYFSDSNSTEQNFDLIKIKSELSSSLTADNNMSLELQRSYADYSVVKFLGDCFLHRELNKIFYDILIKEFLQKTGHSFIRMLLDSWWNKYGGQITNESAESFSVHFSSVNDQLRWKVLSLILREKCREIFKVLFKAFPHPEPPASELTVDFVKMLMDLSPKSNPNYLFLQAVKSENLNVCKWLLDSETFDINTKLQDGRTLADVALQTSDIGILRLLETKGVEVRIENSDRLNEIYANICKLDSREDFKWLLQRGMTLETLSKDGSTLLHVAARSASSNFFAWLVYRNNGKELVHYQNDNDHTPLHVAIASNNLPAVKVLIENGASAKLTDEMGFTLLHYAAMHSNEETCLYLLHSYEDVNLKTNEGNTPLLVAAQANNLAAVKALIKNGADFKSVDDNGYSILHFAASFGDREMLLTILNHLDDVNSKTKQNQTPLHIAIYNGNFEAVKVLIENNADIQLRDDDGYSVQDIAILTENIEICSHLLHHFDINTRNGDGRTPLLFAAFKNKLKSLEFLIENGADMKAIDNYGWTVLHYIAQHGNRETCSHVLDKYIDINIRNNDGLTPLHVALSNCNFNAIKVLIENKADVNLTDEKGWTVWHYAASAGNTEICSYLLNHSREINVRDKFGYTPLLVAASKNKLESLKFLIENSADMKAVDNDGWTVLLTIARSGNRETCLYVLDKYRNINVKTKNGVTPLHVAVKNSNLETVKVLIENGADVTLAGGNGWTVWHNAASAGNTEICSYLLKRNREINVRSKIGRTPLLVAATNNKLESLKFLIENGADMKAVSNEGWTVLHYIAQYGNRETCLYVLDKYRNINVKTKNGVTPLHVAVKNSNLETVKVLIENGADVTLAGGNGWTVWHNAASAGNTEICSYLLNCNREINVRSKIGNTPLLVAATNNKLESLKFSIETGADVKAVDNDGWTVLHTIARYGNRETCSYVLGKYKDINVRGKDGVTPLHVAVCNSNLETVKVLIENGADVTLASENGWTVWHNAASAGNTEICSYLLNCNREINVRSKIGNTPLLVAASKNKLESLKFLIENGADMKAVDNNGWRVLHKIAQHGNRETCSYVLDKYKDINVRGKNSVTPLHVAVGNSNLETVKVLIENRADVTLVNETGWTVWHDAASAGNTEICSYLLDRNHEINVRSKIGNTPLLVAASKNKLESLKFLIENGADMKAVSNDGWTVLHYIAQFGNRETCSYVLDKYKDINIRKKDGLTPLHIAVYHSNLETVKVLIENGADLSAKAIDGTTIWHYAVRDGNNEICLYLLDSCTDGSLRRKNTEYALSLAEEGKKIKQLLLDRIKK